MFTRDACSFVLLRNEIAITFRKALIDLSTRAHFLVENVTHKNYKTLFGSACVFSLTVYFRSRRIPGTRSSLYETRAGYRENSTCNSRMEISEVGYVAENGASFVPKCWEKTSKLCVGGLTGILGGLSPTIRFPPCGRLRRNHVLLGRLSSLVRVMVAAIR